MTAGNFFSLLWNHITLHMNLVILPGVALLMLDLQDTFKIC